MTAAVGPQWPWALAVAAAEATRPFLPPDRGGGLGAFAGCRQEPGGRCVCGHIPRGLQLQSRSSSRSKDTLLLPCVLQGARRCAGRPKRQSLPPGGPLISTAAPAARRVSRDRGAPSRAGGPSLARTHSPNRPSLLRGPGSHRRSAARRSLSGDRGAGCSPRGHPPPPPRSSRHLRASLPAAGGNAEGPRSPCPYRFPAPLTEPPEPETPSPNSPE
ncbi:uncharacterized protein LOC134564411 [Prinia subflava]|uniref:uncharacterized protein LOC134564411 n=1 Tax=Prinia subflava TaxID=208062 RepID=UPI002FE2A275